MSFLGVNFVFSKVYAIPHRLTLCRLRYSLEEYTNMNINFLMLAIVFTSSLVSCGAKNQNQRLSQDQNISSQGSGNVQKIPSTEPVSQPAITVLPTQPAPQGTTEKISLQIWSAIPSEDSDFQFVPVKS